MSFYQQARNDIRFRDKCCWKLYVKRNSNSLHSLALSWKRCNLHISLSKIIRLITEYVVQLVEYRTTSQSEFTFYCISKHRNVTSYKCYFNFLYHFPVAKYTSVVFIYLVLNIGEVYSSQRGMIFFA